MKLELNNDYFGFHFIREKYIKEINSTGRVFQHQPSGAHLLHLENDDDNKVFSISFRTPPWDSTGIPHILEHSVLCGSRKFPTKEPFVELVKGSLNTFLNAMTFSDKTMYPVASRNHKDFFNLMDVYLDAVFYPNVYRYPEILMQEGWHYEIESEDREIQYKGVVYNEMKGVYSSPESMLFRNILQSLFPETCYGYESGGDPDAIPGLTREYFLSFHKKYYHPSNSYIYLYGDGDILRQLEFLHEEYLKEFNRITVDSSILLQKAFSSTGEIAASYPLAPDEEEKEKSYLSMNFVTGLCTDRELYMAMNILEYLLMETPAAPLKKALLDAKIGKDVFGQYESSILQPVFSIIVKHSSEHKKEAFVSVVFDTLRNLVKKGIDKKLIEASVNIKEFRLREADYRGLPKGLVYCIQCMDSWLYDSDPFIHLEYEQTLSKVKEALTDNYFEALIDRYLLTNTHSSLVIVNPEKGLTEKKEMEVKEKLSQLKDHLTGDEILQLVNQTVQLKKRQAIPDPPELLAKIPLLTLGDVNPEAEKLPLELREEGGRPVLFHSIFTSKIVYLNLFFDVAVPKEDLPYVTLLSYVLGKISTEKYEYADLSNEINIHTGGIFFRPETFCDKDNDALYYPRFMIKSKALSSKLPRLCELIGELVGHTRFDDTKRLKEIVQETKSRIEMSIYESGHLVAISRLLSYFSPIGSYSENLSGLSFYKFIKEIEKNFDLHADEIMSRVKATATNLFKRAQLQVSVTTEADDYRLFRSNFPIILDEIGDSSSRKATYQIDTTQKNEGLLTPGKVQYVVKGYNFRKLGYGYHGSLLVLRTIASMDYLWNRIRVQGGAYGSFARFSRNGNMYFCSYRDPNLIDTLSVYDTAEDYFKTFDVAQREMTKYIIGTISKIDVPLTPSMKGEVATERYFTGISHEDVQRTREEVLGTGKNDIKKYAEMVGDAMRENYFCVIGNEGKLRAHSKIFSHLVSVFES